ncbi:M12 family metallo-peptidase [Vibrio harveyi]|uniref:M12 family metallo-peptidase n=1 Tax=Vibrio harveyi TaxID=669 RepID=UPI00247FE2CC|nr:M12 family metallo-peptidase [Vibrio harveyi]
MERLLVSSALALTCLSAQAVELEVSLMYSDGYVNDTGVLVSSEIIGFYRSLDAANSLFSDSNVDLSLAPAKIYSVDAKTYDPTLNVLELRSELERKSLEDISDSAGHFVVGIARYPTSSGAIGYALPFNDAAYAKFDADPSYKQTKKFALASGVTNSTSNPRYKYVLGHELLHTLGAAHDQTGGERFDSYSLGNNFGHGEDCGNGNMSLMAESSVSASGTMMLSGIEGCNAGNGDMVRFIKEYAPRVSKHENYLHMNTMTMNVIEDVAESEFEFTVTRTKDLSNSAKAYVHVSGSNASITNEIAPVEVAFDANQATKTVTVPFSSIHPMFEDAKESDKKVFAVAISNTEVMNQLVDLSGINTQWRPDSGSGGNDGDDNGNGNNGNNGGNTSSNGGGSVSFLGLISLLSFGLFRRRKSLL